MLVHYAHIYRVLTFGCHNPLSIDFGCERGPNGHTHTLTPLTCGHIASYVFTVNMAYHVD